MTDDKSIESRLLSIQKKAADFAVRWREWAHSNQPNIKRCEAHAFDRKVNEERSISMSWQRQEMIIVFKACPGCWREKNQQNKKGKK